NVDLFYYTGSMQAGYLIIPHAGEAIYYVRRSLQRALEESVVPAAALGSFRAFGDRLKTDYPALMGAERLVIATEYDTAPAALVERMQALIPHAQWCDGSSLVREQRMIKSPYEIGKIKEAAKVIDEALTRAIGYLYEGMPEYE